MNSELPMRRNMNETNTRKVQFSVYREDLGFPNKVVVVYVTHRLLSARSHWTKHVTWYKIGRRISGAGLFESRLTLIHD